MIVLRRTVIISVNPHKGSPKSALTREKIRSKALGRKRSEESCKKQSKTMTGEGNHFFGKHHSMKTLELLHKPKAKEAVLKMATTKIRNNQVSLLRPLFGDKAELIRKLDSDIYIKIVIHRTHRITLCVEQWNTTSEHCVGFVSFDKIKIFIHW